MGTNGVIYTLTVDMTPSPITLLWLNPKAVTIQGSLVTSRVGLRNMLTFCDKHSITPKIQKYTLDSEGITKAMQDLRDGQVRYRAVLVAQ
jgi:D-arabinose 1-dehydrogenase-like Zn-dependent alcohol dehydrogenase